MSQFISQRRLVFPAVEGRISVFSGSAPGASSALVLLGALVLLWSV